MKLLLGKFQSGFTLDNLSRFLQGDQSDGIVLRVEQAIELRAVRHRGLGQAAIALRSLDLADQHAFDGNGGDLLVKTFLAQPNCQTNCQYSSWFFPVTCDTKRVTMQRASSEL